MSSNTARALKLRHREPIAEKFERLNSSWKVLVVDDESEVHTISRLILKDLKFEGHSVELLNAYSGDQAKEMLTKHNNIALVLLDVVMETESAGLDLVEFIRHDLDNSSIRIILRTGHPGQAPESQVIFNYDINDYKSKNELTARKLVTSVISALRAYRSLKNLELSRQGLEMILDSTDSLFEFASIEKFATGVLYQLASFLSTEPSGLMCLQPLNNNFQSKLEVDHSVKVDGEIQVIGSMGALRLEVDIAGSQHPELIKNSITLAKAAFIEQETIFEHGLTALYVGSKTSQPAVAILYGVPELSEQDKFLLDLYISKISLALANIIHYNSYIEANDAARTDVLTGLPNRRDYVESGKKFFDDHQKAKQPMTLAVLDLDGFKPVNDKYGHDIGDSLLKAFAKFVEHSLKSSDYFARIGGDEFAVILQNTDCESAKNILQRLLEDLLSHSFNLEKIEVPIKVGMSIGADCSFEGGFDEMFKRADSRLYASKQQGRNCVTMN
ncbi:diguanylate cyclase [Thiomicrorhabdus indica]|uniref:diguanylate cyclase n=1 Tax=Thiomicrorhabdus indica TaxID=2267253 RepID=UPI00102E0DB9|nr:diguanylate cyclase [Thiomicrorhabdus indica]